MHSGCRASTCAEVKELPEDVVRYAGTPVFSEGPIPAKLRRGHRTKPGIRARIVVLEGRLRFRILEPETEEAWPSPGRPGIVEAQVLHEVEALGRVRFRVEFHR